MRNHPLVIVFLAAALASGAQPSSSIVVDYEHLIRFNETRLRTEMKITDDRFFDSIDTLMGYAKDSRFDKAQQLLNLQGLARFLNKINDKEQIRSGQTTNLLLFYFSVMDWRREGSLYENLNSFSGFAMKCGSFFEEDSAGIKFIAKTAEKYPSEILIYADQLSDNRRYRPIIEDAILKDPDYAKRYFFNENTISYYASTSERKEVRGIYELFEKWGNKNKGFILYDAVRKGHITPPEADSIYMDERAMIREMVWILKNHNPLGLRSVFREMDFRATDYIRQSTLWAPEKVYAQFNKFSAEEKLTLLVFGYHECGPALLDQYITLLLRIDLMSVSPTLIENLGAANLPEFLRFLDKHDKLPLLLGWFSDANKEKLSLMLSSDENETGQSESLESLPPNKMMAPEARAEVPPGKTAMPDRGLSEATGMAERRRRTAEQSDAVLDNIVADPIHIPLSDSSRDILILKKNIFMALQDISSFIDKPYARDLMLYAAYVEPDEVFKKTDLYKGKYWSRDVLEAATLNAPLSAKRYFNNPTHPVTVILGYSKDTTIQKFLRLSRESKFETKPFLLFDEMANNCMTLTDASAVCTDNDRLFRELMTIASQKNYIGRYNVEREMNYYALKYIRGINDKDDEPERERFASVDNLSCNELYYLMVYGREEVFNATFEGLFSRFLSKCATSGYWNAKRFILLPHYRRFLAMCAAYNKLDKFLSLFSAGDQNILLTSFASSLDKERDELSDAATVGETIANTTNPVVLQVLQNTIKASYINLETAHDYNGMAIYGILCALYKDKAVSDKKWFAVMAKKYKIGALTTLTNASLMGQKIFVERMYFYDDEDGQESYKNFIATFTASPDWRVDQYFSYTRVSSTHGKNIEIYANKPELEESGDREISKIIKDNNYVVSAIIHRGHSFHTDATLARVPSSARFIFVGSCGGFYKINLALHKAPDANIISTRQVGVKEINDPIIFSFNEYVREGKDINWKTFWDEMYSKLGRNSLFSDYVPPHKNLESLFVRAYYQIMGNE